MRVRSSLRRSLTALVGALLLAATILPAAVLATEPDPSAGYHATATVTRPDDSVRTDGSIAVGDDLSIVYAAVDGTNILKCFISVVTVGSSVQVPVYGSQGECRFSMRLPELQSEAWRALSDDPGRELCVVATLWFADSEERAMVESDRLQPGGSTCGEGGPFRDYQEKLEFHIDAAGATDRPFVSDPQFLSWDPTDWGTDMQPLRFGEDWTFALPDWVSSCRTFINGTWQTSITAQHGDSCADWHVRIPGILPAAMPFSGDDEWHTSLVAQYSVPGQDMMFSAIGFTTVPLESSDGVFESDLPAVFPTDLAKTRFVTIGEAWTPSFQVSGVTATSCHLEVHVNQAADVLYDVAPNDAGICTFDVPAMVQGEFHQYHVYAVPEDDPSNNEINFGGNISAIPAPEPPVIETPTLEAGGDTGLDVEAGDGQGLAVDLEVTAETPAAGAAAATTTSARTTAGTTLASPVATPVCTDQAVSTDLEVGGAIPTLEALCDLAPGSYVATATMVDAAGVTSTAHRTFSVPVPAPRDHGPHARPVRDRRGPRRPTVGHLRHPRHRRQLGLDAAPRRQHGHLPARDGELRRRHAEGDPGPGGPARHEPHVPALPVVGHPLGRRVDGDHGDELVIQGDRGRHGADDHRPNACSGRYERLPQRGPGRALLRGRQGPECHELPAAGQRHQRVCPGHAPLRHGPASRLARPDGHARGRADLRRDRPFDHPRPGRQRNADHDLVVHDERITQPLTSGPVAPRRVVRRAAGWPPPSPSRPRRHQSRSPAPHPGRPRRPPAARRPTAAA